MILFGIGCLVGAFCFAAFLAVLGWLDERAETKRSRAASEEFLRRVRAELEHERQLAAAMREAGIVDINKYKRGQA